MSKLQELIQRLCPDGVEYKKLGEIGTFIRGNGLQKKDFTESGVGCIHYGQIYTYYGTFATETKSFVSPEMASKLLIVKPGNLVIACTSENVEDVGKAVAWLGNNDIVTGGHSVVFRHNINPKYVAYFFQTQTFFAQKKRYAYGAKVIDIKTEDLAKIVIPVPPLEVQEEIVRILDRFDVYAAELQAELQARKEQYEYYRNLLLTFNPAGCAGEADDEQEGSVTTRGGHSYPIHWKTMGEIIKSLNTGLNPRQFFRLNTADAECFYVTIREIRNGQITINEKTDRINQKALQLCNNRSNLEKFDILFSGTGTIGQVAVIKHTPKNWNIKEGVYAIKPKLSEINPFFLRYILESSKIKESIFKKVSGGTVQSIPMKDLKSILLPVPPLELQEKIVAVLDRFETLVNDLSEGLPAEIAAVKEQYEYYRNRLLTFKEKTA